MEQKDTKKQILDAAEQLFARQGYHGTSMRNITGTAGVNLAAVNYHFGSKEALLEAVFDRRLQPLNRERIERMEQAREFARGKGVRPSVREVLLAFMEPTIRLRESDDGAEHFISLVGQSLAGQDDLVRRVFLGRMTPVIMTLFGALREALPSVPETVLLWRMSFALGSLSHTMHLCSKAFSTEFMELRDERLKSAQEALCCTGTDTGTLVDMLTTFVAAGMEAP